MMPDTVTVPAGEKRARRNVPPTLRPPPENVTVPLAESAVATPLNAPTNEPPFVVSENVAPAIVPTVPAPLMYAPLCDRYTGEGPFSVVEPAGIRYSSQKPVRFSVGGRASLPPPP